MMTVVPARRMAPTDGNVPLRTFQYISQVAGSVENAGTSTVAMPANAPKAASMRNCSATAVSARTSINRAAASSPSVRITWGKPGLASTERRAGRSSNSTADTGSFFKRITAWQALSMVGKNTSALALNGSSTTVR